MQRGQSVKLVRNPDYWKTGRPYHDGIEWKVIENCPTRILAFVAGDFDLTFPTDVTIPLLKDVTAQAPKAICELAPTSVSTNLIINREVAPFNDPLVRKAMALVLDRQAFVDILSSGKANISGVMLPPPEGVWRMPPYVLKTLPGYSADVASSRAEARKIMEKLGYNESNPLKVKISTRNIAVYRDPAVILIDQLKTIHVQGELEVIDTSIWHAKVARKEYTVGLNLTGVGVDDPDVNLYENYSCNSQRNCTQYCNKEVDALIDKRSDESTERSEARSYGRSSASWRKTLRDPLSFMIARQRAGSRRLRASCCTRTASTTIGALRRVAGVVSRTPGWPCQPLPSVPAKVKNDERRRANVTVSHVADFWRSSAIGLPIWVIHFGTEKV